ncbi:hypothetical protein CDD83_8826 [Cordyceps sp. RAO-2017]|nr:hypothetical protein CDD83_8826 [Cordyceps sp. RAO-2017]
MASKRNSRVFVDEAKHRDAGHHKPTASAHRSRRDSHGSVKDETTAPGQDADGGQRIAPVVKDATASAPRSRSTSSGSREALVTSSARIGDKTAAAATSTKASIATRVAECPSVPLHGRPANFGLVIPGLYRSSYPTPDDYAFLQSLHLKTVVTLVKRDDVDHELETFASSNGIRHVVFDMRGTKKEAIPVATMTSILRVVLDRQHYPLLLHCNHGKHRTGCVVAIVRKLSGWGLDSTLDEYRTYAAPKVRECDVDYISGFDSSSIRALSLEPSRISPVQVRTFFRTLLFSTFVMVLWLVSGSKMPLPPNDLVA